MTEKYKELIKETISEDFLTKRGYEKNYVEEEDYTSIQYLIRTNYYADSHSCCDAGVFLDHDIEMSKVLGHNTYLAHVFCWLSSGHEEKAIFDNESKNMYISLRLGDITTTRGLIYLESVMDNIILIEDLRKLIIKGEYYNGLYFYPTIIKHGFKPNEISYPKVNEVCFKGF